MITQWKAFTLAAALAVVPALSSAVTLTVDDLGTAGVDAGSFGPSTALFSGTAGGFNVNIAVGTINTVGSTYQLNATSIETAGTGTLEITVEETSLTGFSAPSLELIGSGSVSDIGSSVDIEHYIDLGSGYQLIDSAISFIAANGDSQSGTVSDFVAGAASFDLRTIITITNTVSAFTSNVSATLTASAVPLPAAAWLFGSALLGLVTVARRKPA